MADNEAKLRISAENRTKQAFDEIKRSMREVETAGTTLRNAFAGLGVGLSVAGFASAIKSAIDLADELGKTAQRVGFTVESLSALRYAGDLADVSMEQLSTGLRQLSKNMADTQAGTGDAKDAFKALGINVESVKGSLKTSEQVLFEIADSFAGMEDGAGKTAIAMRIFGRSGADLIPLLNSGADGLRNNAEEAKRFGLIISTDAAKAAEEFNDNLTRLKSSSSQLSISLANELLPSLSEFVDKLLFIRQLDGVDLFGKLFLGGTSTKNIGGQITQIEKDIEDLRKKRDALSKSPTAKAIENIPLLGGDIATLDRQIATFEAKLKLLQQLGEKQRTALDAEDAGFRPSAPRRAAPKLDDGSDKSKTDAALKQAEELRKAFEEVQALGRSLGISDDAMVTWPRKTKEDIAALKSVLQEGRKDWIAYAEAVFAAAESQDTLSGSGQSFTQWAEALRDKVLDNIEPTRAWQRELADLKVLLDTGYLSVQQFNQATLNPRLRELLKPVKDDFTLLNEALQEGDISLEQYTDAVTRLRGEIDKTKESGDDFGFTFESAFEKAIIEGEKFSEVVKGIEKDLAKMIIRKSVTEPLGNAVSAAIKDSGFDLGKIFGGARAGGGDVTSGKAYLVGEEGPELFVPSSSGSIVPNGGWQGGSTYYIDARGADQAAIARLERQLMALHATVERRSVAATFDASRRGAKV